MSAKNNLLDSLHQLMFDQHFHCEWGLDWIASNHYFTLSLQYHLPNPKREVLTDPTNELLDTKTIFYELQVIFYDDVYTTALRSEERREVENPLILKPGTGWKHKLCRVGYDGSLFSRCCNS